ncbi:universal stress protein [Fictibacillus iocasae]|uniref:Universal stress protein n=1 Tax=Fictibacillus iocasae TaxID=2715437 RepID=A0ABW2NRL4_9BACL
MTIFSRIVVAYDGSELSKMALNQAVNLVKENSSSELHVLTVYEPEYVMSYTHPLYTVDNGAFDMKIDTEEKLKTVQDQLSSELSNPVFTTSIQGHPGQEIVKYANDQDAELIVIGSRGLSNLKELFLGSCSHYVVQKSTCPVFIIK